MNTTYAVEVQTTFEASHRIDIDGSVAPVHAHRWRVTVRATSSRLDAISIVVDFRKLLEQTDRALDPLRGRVLEDTPELRSRGGSPLAVARWLLEGLDGDPEANRYVIDAVTVGCDPRIDFTVRGGED